MTLKIEARKYFMETHRVSRTWVSRHCKIAGEDLSDLASIIRFARYVDKVVGFYEDLVSCEELEEFLYTLGISSKRSRRFMDMISCRYDIGGVVYYEVEYVLRLIRGKFKKEVDREALLLFLKNCRRGF